ncbi:DNA polymerase III subunit chi [Aliiroseovarius sp.]|uniref:DNA polymerase III subunit chi n=1 Tax=Aliiroseovarius sp. TaxID=1872442 RepID=UPI002630E795|nr:DNA polymerase III subunit chi [Aliiroseovarius sp.]
MSEVFFYHMTHAPLEATLPFLLGKSLEAGWQVVVRGREARRIAWLDEKLWLGPEEGFLPHGRAGGPHDLDQPILLTTDDALPNDAAALVSIDGADVTAEELAGLTRAMILFDGNDPQAVDHARAQWKALTGAGVKAKYWSQESGHWEMKAESR